MNNADIESPRPERLETSFRIFVDQAGYLPTAEKAAVFTFPAGYYSVINETGSICFSGVPVPAGADEASGETLFKADFSRLTAPGTYRIISGTDFSPVFRIGEDVYKNCFDDCMKAFYFQRCGCALEEKYAGMWTHEKCHSAPAVLWEDHSVKLDVTGGWHDAGDYGKYVTAAAAALAHLLYAWKMFPEAFRRQDLNIPGKPSNMPDILIECRWELEWLLKMQRFDGAVWHKATTAKHAAFVMPEDDREQIYVLPVSSSATADFAAVTALASGIYREFDKAFSGRLLKSSCAAYEWLEKYPGFIGFDNPEGCETGVYGERNDRDNRFWAAAELFAIFDNEMYYARLLNLLNENFSLTSLGFASVGGFGSLALLLHNRGNAAVLSKLRSAFLAKAEELAKVCDSNGWGVSLKPDQYNWGSNMTVLTNGMTFLIADYLEKRSINGDPHFRKYAAMQLDYILGVNATGYSYITGTGSLCVNYPHHRPAHADKVEECIPGLVSGGANSRLDDKFARALIPKGTPPMKCFSDNMECYSLNEVTIYWNSPAVFLLAGLTE